MKTKLFMAAAIAACFGLMTAVTSCEGTDPENTDQTEQGGEQGDPITDPDDDGGEPVAEVSIYKQWVGTGDIAGEDGKILFDFTDKTTLQIAVMTDFYKELLEMYEIEFNEDTDFYPMDAISNVSVDEEAGLISGTGGFGINSVQYKDLTAKTVSITYGESTYSCSAAETTMNIIDMGM